MKCILIKIFACLSLLSASDEINQELALELHAMCVQDQDARLLAIESHEYENVEKIDQKHLPRLKSIIQEYGWPGYKLVGKQGADDIWLLIQHCDQDFSFQKHCLRLLQEAVEKDDASKTHLAYLTDRVLIHEHKPQLYGTQIEIIDCNAKPFPTEDHENLEMRRKKVDLPPLADYLDLFKEVYKLSSSS